MDEKIRYRCAEFGVIETDGMALKLYASPQKYETCPVDFPADDAMWVTDSPCSGCRKPWPEILIQSAKDDRTYTPFPVHTYVKTDYCVKGPKKSLDEFYEFMMKFTEPETIPYYNQLRGLTGDIFNRLGLGDVGAHDGFWRQLRRTEDGVEFTLWSKFGPIYYQACFLRSRFPGLRFLFRCQGRERQNTCVTNDADGERFPERWMSVCCKKVEVQGEQKYRTDRQYFLNEEDALRHIGEFMEVETPKDADAVKAVSEKYEDANEFCHLRHFCLVDDFGEPVAE